MANFELLSLAFEYEGTDYHSLIRVKKTESGKEYHVTVMNGKLERMLYGNHVIHEVNGRLQVQSLADKKVSKLKYNITQSLCSYLMSNQTDTLEPAQKA